MRLPGSLSRCRISENRRIPQVGAEYEFVRQFYDEALRTVCTTTDDLECWLDLLVFEGEFDRAFDEVIEGEKLCWFLVFASPLGGVGPETYFEAYREQLVPFAARKTGRSHYKKIAKHLDGMEQFLAEERLEEFVDFLKEKHSNRPAFLDELRKAGY